MDCGSSRYCRSDHGVLGTALIADELACPDRDVFMLDNRDVWWGSTSAGTVLLQVEIDAKRDFPEIRSKKYQLS